jgi:hypothetical protein
LLAKNNTKVLVRDSYGKTIFTKDLTSNESAMLDGSNDYYVTSDNIKNLEVYLDGVLIKDVSKVRNNGQTYKFTASDLVTIAESQQNEPLNASSTNGDLNNETGKSSAPNTNNPSEIENGNKTQNNPQSKSR